MILQEGEILQLVSPAPAWLQLGEPQLIDGVEVREVFNDFSDLNSFDRLPRYISNASPHIESRPGFDRSDSRPQVRQVFPGKPISDLANTQSGRVAIFFNGPSLAGHDLWAISEAGISIIGMNRTHQGWPTYHGPQPNWLCIIDHVWFDRPDWSPGVLAHPLVINGSSHPSPIGYRVVRHPRMTPFSFDLARDGYVGPVPCTTGYLALQLALYLGFTDIYCLGLDMQGGHFDGTKASLHYPAARAHLRRIAKAVSEHRSEVRIWLCGSPDSACDAFPKVPYEALLSTKEAAA